ncbi:MAG: antibiotic biosynthesis monooxygenase family protein [Candidatus Acidiferrales bacterium]
MSKKPLVEAPLIQFVWEFIAREDRLADFERYYSPAGAWAKLFEKNSGYAGTQLLRDSEKPRRYLTVDTWENIEHYHAMRRKFAGEFERLDQACEEFTEVERRIGAFEVR